MKFCLMDADYEVHDGKPVITLSGVDEKGNRVVVEDEFLPYLYATSYRKTQHVVKTENVKMRLGGKDTALVKVYVDLPHNVQKVRDMLKKHANCYEYSVNFYKRYLIDKGFYPLDWIDNKSMKKVRGPAPRIKVMAFDMEVVDGKIVMISYASSSKKSVLAGDEKDMIEKFINVLDEEKPHIIATYNGDGYDFSVLRQRMEELKVKGLGISFEKHAYMSSARVSGFVHIDLFNFVNNLIFQQLASEVYTLAEVSEELLGKTKQELSYEEVIKMSKKKLHKIKK